MIFGTVGVIALSLFVGTLVGMQASVPEPLGYEAFTGFLSAYFNTREVAPLVASIALTAPSGAATPRGSARCGSPRRSTRSR